jgi:hypothetical protein
MNQFIQAKNIDLRQCGLIKMIANSSSSQADTSVYWIKPDEKNDFKLMFSNHVKSMSKSEINLSNPIKPLKPSTDTSSLFNNNHQEKQSSNPTILSLPPSELQASGIRQASAREKESFEEKDKV